MQTTRCFRHAICVVLPTLTIGAGAFAQETGDPYAEVVRYKFNQPRAAVVAIEAEIRAAKPGQLRGIEAKLLKILQSPDATTDAKQWVCRQLRQAGSEQSVTALAALLPDKEVGPVAQFALRSIPGAQVDAALRDALGRVQSGLKAGIIQTIGARGDRQAVPLIAPLASDKDLTVAEAALYALGHIGGAEALKALQGAKVAGSLRRYRNHAMLLCAEGLAAQGKLADASAVYHAIYRESSDRIIKLGAVRGILRTDKAKAAPVIAAALREDNAAFCATAAKFLCEPESADALKIVLADMTALAPDVQAMILKLVNDPIALPAARSAAGSSDETLRLSALTALGRLDDASSVGLLLRVAATEREQAQTVARRSLIEIRSKEADTALMAAAQTGETALRAEAVRTLAARNTTAAVPMLLKLATDASVRAEAFEALGALADEGAVPSLISLLVEAKTDADRAGAEKALLGVGRRTMDSEAMVGPLLGSLPGPNVEARCALLRVLARIPSAKSLEALRAAAKDGDASVKDTAIRGLADWRDAAVMSDLLDVARAAQNKTHRVLALRGFVRLAAL
ncbi:MAG: HEAT repeat domain-containing protein [Verrucomicrobiae bacterium]|nr:HEAT repeat domain-containing protein [Verrucomicrobiae bacterium]